MEKKNRLGKGLGALISESSTYQAKTVKEAISTGSIAFIDVEKVETNPFQPRVKFDEIALGELAESIKQLGVIQPITVRKIKDNKFQLISGERRLRASKIIGLEQIPAFVRDANDQEMLEFSLVENIQREDLNAIEVAITYQRLIDECSLTQEKLSERTGKGRSTVANYLRLLNLPPEIQAGLRASKITSGHARALVTIADKYNQLKIYYKILSGGLSVRITEELVKEVNQPMEKEKKEKAEKYIPENFLKHRDVLSNKLNTKIDIKVNKKGKGKIVINFKNEEELEKIVTKLKMENGELKMDRF